MNLRFVCDRCNLVIEYIYVYMYVCIVNSLKCASPKFYESHVIRVSDSASLQFNESQILQVSNSVSLKFCKFQLTEVSQCTSLQL